MDMSYNAQGGQMIKVTETLISPESVVKEVKASSSGCVVTYVGLIRDHSRGKQVQSVTYEDASGKAEEKLRGIADEIKRKWPVDNVAIHHRVGRLNVGDINLVVAIAAPHRAEGFAACQFAIDQFKRELPTSKREAYLDGSVWEGN
jgi:molybdopterin synthase catalytic subunit